MDISSTVAAWLSLAATVVGLGSIAIQFRSIIDQTDPFHALRNVQYLGRWWSRQAYIPWYRLIKPPPVGPIISANLLHGLCGRRTIEVSRLPLACPTGRAAWSVLLAVIHPTLQIENCQIESSSDTLSKGSDAKSDHILALSDVPARGSWHGGWDDLPLCPLVKHNLTTCTIISRTTLIALFCVTNARPVFRHSSASGHRATYASYCGQWRVEWPLGGSAHVYFSAHDSHSLSKDVYPTTFKTRVDKCLQILVGVIDTKRLKCAFPGRKQNGEWILQYAVKGFGGAHGGRHLYNMIGGNVTDVDFLFMKPLSVETEPSQDTVTLYLPNSEDGKCDVILYVAKKESNVLDKALDCLPWSALSWSVHRGLRDILVAFAKDRMDRYRDRLAETLRSTVIKWPERLDAKGWDPQFVRGTMADIAASAVSAGSGNSGDAVRIVADITLTLWDGPMSQLDETTFWRDEHCNSGSSALSPMAVVALVKCFVLEWSIDLDYQMYHDFPLEMYLG